MLRQSRRAASEFFTAIDFSHVAQDLDREALVKDEHAHGRYAEIRSRVWA